MSDEANEDVVLIEQRDRILIVTINRPRADGAVNQVQPHVADEATVVEQPVVIATARA